MRHFPRCHAPGRVSGHAALFNATGCWRRLAARSLALVSADAAQEGKGKIAAPMRGGVACPGHAARRGRGQRAERTERTERRRQRSGPLASAVAAFASLHFAALRWALPLSSPRREWRHCGGESAECPGTSGP